jgi:hypothetical protein
MNSNSKKRKQDGVHSVCTFVLCVISLIALN